MTIFMYLTAYLLIGVCLFLIITMQDQWIKNCETEVQEKGKTLFLVNYTITALAVFVAWPIFVIMSFINTGK